MMQAAETIALLATGGGLVLSGLAAGVWVTWRLMRGLSPVPPAPAILMRRKEPEEKTNGTPSLSSRLPVTIKP